MSFFPSELIPFCHAERSQDTFLHGSSSWVPGGTRPLLMSCWFPSPLTHFLHHWVADRYILFLFLVFLYMSPWTVLIPTRFCCVSRGSQAPRNPQVSWPNYFPGLPSDFSNPWGLGWAFSFLCFMKSETCPFMDLGPSLWTSNRFGPLLLFLYQKPKCFTFRDFIPLRCFGPWYNHCDFFWTSTVCQATLFLYKSLGHPRSVPHKKKSVGQFVREPGKKKKKKRRRPRTVLWLFISLIYLSSLILSILFCVLF